ncbi:MAG TPA: peptidoglycan-binding domain-containing protein [Pseudomonadota bacterium]|nr:peptidoglycan-binding domain-containing protein [Pseudomonadota bacterium]
MDACALLEYPDRVASLRRADVRVSGVQHVDIERDREAQMPFGKGSRGNGVVQLQQALNGWITSCHALGVDTGLIEVVADGTFGQNTAVALAAYQKSAGLPPSGYADQDTLLRLELDGTLEANGTMWAGGGGV